MEIGQNTYKLILLDTNALRETAEYVFYSYGISNSNVFEIPLFHKVISRNV